MEPARQWSSLTICGSGNGAHALAVVASQHLEGHVDWLVGSREKADVMRRAARHGGLHSTGAITAHADKVRKISADPAEVVPNADVVVIVVPAFAHDAVLRRIAPHVNAKTVLGCAPTRGGFDFQVADVIPQLGAGRPSIFGLQTLPWSTRVVTIGELVHIGAVKAEVVLANLPARYGAETASQLTEHLLGVPVLPTGSFLSLTLGNPGQFIHSGLMYGQFRSWSGEQFHERDIPLLYAEASDATGELVARLSGEAIEVAHEVEEQSDGALRLQGAVPPIHDWLRAVYSHVTTDTRTVATCFRTGPIQARKAPMLECGDGLFVPNFDYRYLSEDVPYGLVPTRAVAEIVGVATPTIDEVILWAQRMLKRRYLVNGSLQGPDALDLPLPQNYGISSLRDLVAWYSEVATGSALA